MKTWVPPAPRAKNSKSVVVPDEAAVKIEDNSVVLVTYTEVNPVEVSPSWVTAGPACTTAVGVDDSTTLFVAFTAVTCRRKVCPTSLAAGM